MRRDTYDKTHENLYRCHSCQHKWFDNAPTNRGDNCPKCGTYCRPKGEEKGAE